MLLLGVLVPGGQEVDRGTVALAPRQRVLQLTADVDELPLGHAGCRLGALGPGTQLGCNAGCEHHKLFKERVRALSKKLRGTP